jgi:tetratricopeptide (TPR) repeat protein
MQMGSHIRKFTLYCRFRSTVLLALWLLFLTAQTAAGKELEDRKWIEVRTPNFRIRSVLSEKDSIELARQLETFRAAIFVVTNVSHTDSPIPTEIYAVRGTRDFKSLGISRGAVGIFQSGLRRNLIFIRKRFGMEETTTIMHEYVHFLHGNQGSFNYPKWYKEGFAEYLSAEQTTSGKFVVGGVQKGRYENLSRLSWIPMRQIISPEDYDRWSGERRAMFYAEAWGLVHFLNHRPGRDTFSRDMARYIELVDSGKGDLEAFEEAFMITAKDLDRQVKYYFSKRRIPAYQISTDVLIPDFEPEVIVLSREQVSLALGQAALSRGALDSAERWFKIAVTNENARPRAEAGLGDVLKFRGEYESSQPHFEQAVSLAPSDPYCQLDIAEYWHTRAEKTEDTGKRATYLARAREHYVKAWKLDDSMPETYAQYGQTFLMENQRYDLAIEMLEQAESILPSNIRVRIMLAQAYQGANRKEEAVERARSVLAWSHDESGAAKLARELLAQLTSADE